MEHEWLLKLTSHWPEGCPERASAPRPSRCCLGHPLGWAPGDAMCYSSPCTATVSAWHPDVLRQPPRTSPDSIGMSRPQLQPSSRDPSSKSRVLCLLPDRYSEGGAASWGSRGWGRGLGVGWAGDRGMGVMTPGALCCVLSGAGGLPTWDWVRVWTLDHLVQSQFCHLYGLGPQPFPLSLSL